MPTQSNLREQAWAHHQGGSLHRAEQCYQQLIRHGLATQSLDPGDAVNLGALLRQQGRFKDAIHHYEQCLSQIPNNAQLSGNAINACIACGRHDKAIAIGQTTLKHLPNDLSLQEGIGRALIGSKNFSQSESVFKHLVQQDNTNINHWLGLGQTYFYQQQWQQAEQIYREICTLFPSDTRGPANLIVCLKELGHFQQAQELIDKLAPELQNHNDILGSRAALHMAMQDWATAEQILHTACHRDPDNSVNWLNRAACLRSLKHNNAASRILRTALLIHPNDADLKQAYSQALAELGRDQAAIRLLLQDHEPEQALPTNHLNNVQFLGTGYQMLSSDQCREMAQTWEQSLQRDSPGPLWGDRQRDGLQGRRLRIGYLSADFCNHPVGRFSYPIFQHHNRSKFEIIGLSRCPHDDELHQAFRRNCEGWIDLNHDSDLSGARKIAEARLDILIELGGFTDNNGLNMVVHRPAPIQLSYLGYCGPTYLNSIDGWIGDTTLFGGLNSVDRAAHELLHLPGGYMAYVPEGLPALQAPEMTRPFRFGCFNHSRKLSPRAIALFVQVMKAVPKAELVLKSLSFLEQAEQDRVRSLFLKAGLQPERLKIHSHAKGWEQHMGLYSTMDVALDTLPYSGATTSCEALLMGVPVVTLAGASMAERLSASVLDSANLNHWIASSAEQYVNIARRLAGPNPMVRSLEQRQHLRSQVQHSALGDPERLTQELEALFERLSQR